MSYQTGAYYVDTEPFSERETVSTLITNAATPINIARIGWATPVQGKAVLIRIFISNSQGTAAVVTLWDQDQLDATPAVRGSNAAPLYHFNVPATSDVAYANLPRHFFQGAISAQSTQINTYITVEYAKTIG